MTRHSILNSMFIIAFLIASIMLMTATDVIQPGQAQIVGQIGTSPTNVAGYPNLGPLPSGVTPAYSYATSAYLSATPNPVGVGQIVLVNVWTNPGTTNYFYRQGYKVTIQKPDGTIDIIGPFSSYFSDCTAWFQYAVNQVGVYRFKFEHAGTFIPAGSYVAIPGNPSAYANIPLGASIYYEPSTTEWTNLTVQQDMISSYPPAELPTDYWTRPASPMNREWVSVLGNYPWAGVYYYSDGNALYANNDKHYTAYVQAPNTAHILWRRQGADSGLVGEGTGITSLAVAPGTPDIIYNGRCYQTITKEVNGVPTSNWECYDLKTGQIYWDLTGISATPTHIIYDLGTGAQAAVSGAEASNKYTVSLIALKGGRFYKYNPYTGACTLNITVPSGIGDISATTAMFTQGMVYNNIWVLSTQVLPGGTFRLINWTMSGNSNNFTTRVGSNITWNSYMIFTGIGSNYPIVGAVDFNAGIAANTYWCIAAPNGYTTYADRGGSSYSIGYNVSAVDLKTGSLLFHVAANDTTLNMQTPSVMLAGHGKVAAAIDGRRYAAWDLRTGQLAWTSELAAYPWGDWWPYSTASYDFNSTKGAIISGSYEGVYAFDWDNGKILWHYVDSNAVPFENPYGATPFFSSIQIADGKVYAFNTEHSPSQPISRDWKLQCINATTGEGIWKIAGSMAPGGIADGCLTAGNSYDGYLYVFGKGRSETTVSAPQVTIPLGTGIVIEGKVMDSSPGDQGSFMNPIARIDSPTKPGSVPCVSSTSMATQMQFLYEQQPIDGIWHNETIAGVPVILTGIAADGTVTDIGSVTTNGYYGTFGTTWTPPKAGEYTLIASFAGDDSYGSSSAATTVSVGPAPTSPPTASPPAAPVDYMPTLTGILVAVVIAIILSAIALVVVLRKR